MLKFLYGSATHVGLVREHNEDAGFASPYLHVVADGVGGAAAGEVASATTAYVVSALAMARPTDDPVSLLRTAVTRASEQLRAGIEHDAELAGMATTLTAALARDGKVTVVHVGDSRAYALREGRLTRLTTDHTFVQSLIDAGQLTTEQARSHAYRNMVVNFVGGDHPAEPDLQVLDLALGDRLLLCSDGLTDLVPDGAVAEALAEPDPDAAAAALVAAALAAGGRDNVTCLVADLADGPELRPDGRLLGALRDPGLVVDPTAIRLGRPA